MKLQKIIVVLGPPGSGKGTQSELLAKKLGFPKIVIGDLRREFIRQNSEEAKQDKERYDKGIPAPDDLILKLLKATISKFFNAEGIVLDAYPLSMGQVGDLDKIVQNLNVSYLWVIFLNVPEEEIVKRISIRGQGRSDDDPEIARRRYEEYERRNAPIKDYYRSKGFLIEINGDQTIEDVHKEIMEKLQ